MYIGELSWLYVEQDVRCYVDRGFGNTLDFSGAGLWLNPNTAPITTAPPMRKPLLISTSWKSMALHMAEMMMLQLVAKPFGGGGGLQGGGKRF